MKYKCCKGGDKSHCTQMTVLFTWKTQKTQLKNLRTKKILVMWLVTKQRFLASPYNGSRKNLS